MHNNGGSLDPSRLWLLTTKAREEGAEHGDYRRRLSSELSTNRVCRYRDWGMRRTTTASQRWRSREVLSGLEAAWSQRTRGVGGHRVCTLVRAATGETGYRGVDWRCGGDQDEASPQAKDRLPGRPTFAETAIGKSLSANLGAESGES